MHTSIGTRWSTLVLVGTVCSLQACAEVVPGNTLANDGLQGPGSGTCGMWKDPGYEETGAGLNGLVAMRESDPVRGQSPIDCEKDLVIFVHGWSPSGSPTRAPYLRSWAQKYQTFQFFWTDASKGDPVRVYSEGTQTAAARLKEALRSLGAHLASKGRTEARVQLVGHSYGSKVVIHAAQDLAYAQVKNQLRPGIQSARLALQEQKPEGTSSEAASESSGAGGLGGTQSISSETHPDFFAQKAELKLIRVTLLDPALFLDSVDAAQICGWKFQQVDNMDGRMTNIFAPEAQALRFELGILNNAQVPVEAYMTNVARMFSAAITRYAGVMDLTEEGEGLLAAAEKILGCQLSQQGRGIVHVHNKVVEDYFRSLDAAPPVLSNSRGSQQMALSAAVPPEAIPARAYYRSVEGQTGPWHQRQYIEAQPPQAKLLIIQRTCSVKGPGDDCNASTQVGREF